MDRGLGTEQDPHIPAASTGFQDKLENMNLRFVETFLWVARLGSFNAAAERLNTTQAAVSNRIATLERDLGVRLFERDVRSVRLSAIGQRAVSKAEELVRVANAFRETVGDPISLRA